MKYNQNLTPNCPGCDPNSKDEIRFDTGSLNHNKIDKRDFLITADPWIDEVVNEKNSYFRRFIDLWIIFNGWLTLIIEGDNPKKFEIDSYLIGIACRDEILTKSFENNKKNRGFSITLTQFTDELPIVSRRLFINNPELKKRGIYEERGKFLKRCIDKVTEKEYKYFYPKCFLYHEANKKQVPLDWAHVLQAIYGIRCDLFHGGKSYIYDSDKMFVESAFKILWAVWGENHIK